MPILCKGGVPVLGLGGQATTYRAKEKHLPAAERPPGQERRRKLAMRSPITVLGVMLIRAPTAHGTTSGRARGGTPSSPQPTAKEKYQLVSLHSKQVGLGKERQVVQLFLSTPTLWSTGLLGWRWGEAEGQCRPCPLSLLWDAQGWEEACTPHPTP